MGLILNDDKKFATLDVQVCRKSVARLFSLFRSLCESYDQDYAEHFSAIDTKIQSFIEFSKTPIANDKLKFKHLNSDEEKYKIKTNYDYDIYSYHYLEGQYEYLYQNNEENEEIKHSKPIQFLREFSMLHEALRPQLQSFIEYIEKKIRCVTLLKIWRYRPKGDTPFFLPLHCDRSIFTVIVDTQSEGEECLRLYESKAEEVFLKGPEASASFTPSHSDFPLLFPGIHAKKHFNLDPVPHSVVANQLVQERFSLIFFIVPFEGW